MREIFAIGWGKPDVREHGRTRQRPSSGRASAGSQFPVPTNQIRNARTRPGLAYHAEWYGDAEDICRVHAGLQHNAVGPACP